MVLWGLWVSCRRHHHGQRRRRYGRKQRRVSERVTASRWPLLLLVCSPVCLSGGYPYGWISGGGGSGGRVAVYCTAMGMSTNISAAGGSQADQVGGSCQLQRTCIHFATVGLTC